MYIIHVLFSFTKIQGLWQQNPDLDKGRGGAAGVKVWMGEIVTGMQDIE